MKPLVLCGIDVLQKEGFKRFFNKNVGLVVHSASHDRNLNSTVDIFMNQRIKVIALFAPEHGLFGEEQDQVKKGNFKNLRLNLDVYSLYCDTFKPDPEMFKNIDILIFDLQDVGARFYTYIWTLFLCLKVCNELGKELVVLDRPNPINGLELEGPVLRKDFSSFVGLFPLPIRHAMTIGEIAQYFAGELSLKGLSVIKMENWKRNMWFDETGLQWILPSPNMPTLDTAIVYPGMGLLEGTNISEGRGTTRPFEIFGAPFIDPYKLVEEIGPILGCSLRPLYFKPTFNKFKGQICGGAQIHITDRNEFKPVITTVRIISKIKEMYPEDFRWKEPPYEYEHRKKPFDIIAGNKILREQIENAEPMEKIESLWKEEIKNFLPLRKKYILYE